MPIASNPWESECICVNVWFVVGFLCVGSKSVFNVDILIALYIAFENVIKELSVPGWC